MKFYTLIIYFINLMQNLKISLKNKASGISNIIKSLNEHHENILS